MRAVLDVSLINSVKDLTGTSSYAQTRVFQAKFEYLCTSSSSRTQTRVPAMNCCTMPIKAVLKDTWKSTHQGVCVCVCVWVGVCAGGGGVEETKPTPHHHIPPPSHTRYSAKSLATSDSGRTPTRCQCTFHAASFWSPS
jgi:hypothetical protein